MEINSQVHIQRYSDGIKSPKDAFQLLLTPSVVDTIIHFTNKHAEGDENWTELSQDEFWGFISELIVIGLQKSRKRSISSLWSTDYFIRVPFYSTVMARDRFSNILRHIRFDDPQTRATKIAETGDKFMALRDVFEELRKNSMKAYQPSATVTIDERLIPFRGRCGFKVYMPSKPGKYGIKLWTAADSVNSYAYNMQVYFGGIAPSSSRYQDDHDLEEEKYSHEFLTLGQNYSVAVGSTVVLPCKVNKTENSSYPVLAWKRDNAILTAGSVIVSVNPRIRLMPVQGQADQHGSLSIDYSLEIRDVQVDDAGEYICQIFVSFDQKFKELVHTLEVMVQPKIDPIGASHQCT